MTERARVLAVDDNEVNRAIMQEVLGEKYDLRCASNGLEAIEVARKFRPGLVLLDVMMPGVDGYETCRRLRAAAETRYAKIVLVSAKSQVADRLTGYEAGADDYLVKPFDPGELLAKVGAVVRLKFVEELDRFKSDMLTLLEHETRTPLTVIQSTLDLVRSGKTGDAEQHDHLLEMAFSSCERLSSLIERSTLLCRLRSGDVRLRKDVMPLKPAISAACTRLRSFADACGVAIRADAASTLAICADPDLFATVAQALLHNAVRFSEAGGEVLVEARRDGHRVRIDVVDSGRGIARGQAARLFDELAPRDIGHHSEGHGLSLAICREIIHQHGGDIEAHSEPGKGTRFVVRWPGAATETGVTATP